MAAHQPGDPDIFVFRSASIGLKLQEVIVQEGGPVLLWNISTGRPHLVVPGPWRRQIFN